MSVITGPISGDEVRRIAQETADKLAFMDATDKRVTEALIQAALWELQQKWCERAADIHTHYAKILGILTKGTTDVRSN